MLTLQQGFNSKANASRTPRRDVCLTQTVYSESQDRASMISNAIWDSGIVSNLSRVRLELPAGGTELRLVDMNTHSNNGFQAGPVTITAAVEMSSTDGGAVLDCAVAGRTVVVMERGGPIIFDPLPVTVAAAGFVWSRSFCEFGTNNVAVEVGTNNGSTVNKTVTSSALVFSTDAVTGNSNYGHFPRMLIGQLPDGVVSLVAIGDSITQHFLTNLTTIPVLRLDSGGLTHSSYMLGGIMSHRLKVAKYGTHAFVNLGRNDINADVSLATLQARAVRLWTYLASLGLYVYAPTVTPHTTSSDSFATVENQTITSAPREAIRVAYNAWVRTLPAPLSGYFEAADAVESARDSGKWKANYTPDGLHPAGAGATACAALLSASSFTFPSTSVGDSQMIMPLTPTTVTLSAAGTVLSITRTKTEGPITLAITHQSVSGPAVALSVKGAVGNETPQPINSRLRQVNSDNANTPIAYTDGTTPRYLTFENLPPGMQTILFVGTPQAAGTTVLTIAGNE